MDLDDVSTVPQYMALLKQQKENLAKAQAVRGEKATPKVSRDEIIRHFMLHLMMDSRQSSTSSTMIRSSFIPPAYPPSVVSLGSLRKTKFGDLFLETHHRGRYILVRTVTPFRRITAILTIVEDEDKRVLLLQLYNRGKQISQPQDLPEGAVLVVKEPYVKVSADGNYVIRVDHLSDLIFIPDFDERVPLPWRSRIPAENVNSPAFWKERGNVFFKQARYELAIQCYTKTLECAPPSDLAIATQLNRALCYLKTHQFDAALLDTDAVLRKSETSEKALFRKAQALYYLRRFRECCETHKLLAEKYPENALAKHEFQRASSCLAEENTGKYKFKEMILEAKKLRPPHLEHGTYIGPVAIKDTQTRGRGLFTTRAVKAGDLLLCEKAFAHAFHDEDKPGDLTLLLNVDTNRITLGTHGQLIEFIAQKLHRNPSLVSKFIDLCHGSHETFDIHADGQPVIDTFLVQKIIDLNCFGCPLLSRQVHIKSSDYQSTANDADDKLHSAGIWHMASYINHSCLSNTWRSFIGDMMILRASRDIPADTEITFWYKPPTANPEKSKLQHWGFKCDCAICEESRRLSSADLSTRGRLLATMTKQLQANELELIPIERTLRNLEETYSKSPSEVPRLDLWIGYLVLAVAHLKDGRPEKTIKLAMQGLESIGFVFDIGNESGSKVKNWGLAIHDVVRCWMLIARACREVAPEREADVERYARISYRICVGEDETFDETYSRLSERIDCLIDTFN